MKSHADMSTDRDSTSTSLRFMVDLGSIVFGVAGRRTIGNLQENLGKKVGKARKSKRLRKGSVYRIPG